MSLSLGDLENGELSKLCDLLLTVNVTALAAAPVLIHVLSGVVRTHGQIFRYTIFMGTGQAIGMLIMAVASLLLRVFSKARLESIAGEISEEWPNMWRGAMHQGTGIVTSVVGLTLLGALTLATLVVAL